MASETPLSRNTYPKATSLSHGAQRIWIPVSGRGLELEKWLRQFFQPRFFEFSYLELQINLVKCQPSIFSLILPQIVAEYTFTFRNRKKINKTLRKVEGGLVRPLCNLKVVCGFKLTFSKPKLEASNTSCPVCSCVWKHYSIWQKAEYLQLYKMKKLYCKIKMNYKQVTSNILISTYLCY